jgi:hypothetical protein
MHLRGNTAVPTQGRGQTGVDFIVGVGIFLLTVGFVVSFVPGMLGPFSDEPTGPLVADRIADDLVERSLATGVGTSTLDPDRTRAFFDRTAVPDRLALPDGSHLNVTLEASVSGSAARVVVESPSGTPLAMGEPVPGAGASIATTSRLAAFEGEAVVVVVRLW